MTPDDMLKKILTKLDTHATAQKDLQELLKPTTAAKILGVKEQTLSLWRHRSVGPDYVKVGSNIRYAPQTLAEYVEKQTVRI